ncbi:hypothetical protein Thimo_3382 [Thioflavicoccus mobilis 8321]|uniref:Uncharacterized protein n=1 Tax=Thioflavicoccus mobilis 8321 TaxID=765912 RepID=L0H1Y8_9GAMM|nr:hypothetical protein Thimo_3382 [Thioflavicoccus mobilis 8321]
MFVVADREPRSPAVLGPLSRVWRRAERPVSDYDVPRPVRLMMVRSGLLFGILALGLCSPAVLASDDGGWLELRRDQRIYRERVGPLSPSEDADLRLLERRQGLDLQGLEQRQRWRRQGAPHDRGTGTGKGATAGFGLRQQQRRDADEQRLDWRIEREVLGR